jgi:hypothetical protein
MKILKQMPIRPIKLAFMDTVMNYYICKLGHLVIC